MKQLISKEEIMGLTITNVKELESKLAIIFDGSYILFSVDQGWESGDEAIEVFTDTPNDFILFQVGVITEQEYEASKRKQHEQWQKRQEATELATYNRLRKKYKQ